MKAICCCLSAILRSILDQHAESGVLLLTSDGRELLADFRRQTSVGHSSEVDAPAGFTRFAATVRPKVKWICSAANTSKSHPLHWYCAIMMVIVIITVFVRTAFFVVFLSILNCSTLKQPYQNFNNRRLCCRFLFTRSAFWHSPLYVCLWFFLFVFIMQAKPWS